MLSSLHRHPNISRILNKTHASQAKILDKPSYVCAYTESFLQQWLSTTTVRFKDLVMKWFLYAVSLAWITIGSCSILYTSETKRVFKNILEGTDRRLMSAIPFIAGILFILAASLSRYPWFIRFLGLWALMEGVFVFWNPNDLYDHFMTWHLNSVSYQYHRLWGIISLILGTAVLSWIL